MITSFSGVDGERVGWSLLIYGPVYLLSLPWSALQQWLLIEYGIYVRGLPGVIFQFLEILLPIAINIILFGNKIKNIVKISIIYFIYSMTISIVLII